LVKISSEQKETCKHNSPILSLSWKGISCAFFTGGIDGLINYMSIVKKIFLLD